MVSTFVRESLSSFPLITLKVFNFELPGSVSEKARYRYLLFSKFGCNTMPSRPP